jgi:hypothetical protein
MEVPCVERNIGETVCYHSGRGDISSGIAKESEYGRRPNAPLGFMVD